MRYLVVVEEGPSSFGAYVPDLPGCIAAGATREEVLNLIREAIEFHVDGLKEEGRPPPGPIRRANSSRFTPDVPLLRVRPRPSSRYDSALST